MITDRLAELVTAAIRSASEAGAFAVEEVPTAEFERPRRREHGDWATNVALALAKGGGNPRVIAEGIAGHLPESDLVAKVDVAGPGFLNFHLSSSWLHDVVTRAADPSSSFGRTDQGRGRKINVEYVSANPTGPINVVSGRHAAVGDAISNLLQANGYEVVREFYINDAGRQIDLFARSIAARYLQQIGKPAEIPEDGYQGEYVVELARDIAADVGKSLGEASEDEIVARMRKGGLERMTAQMAASLKRFGTEFNVWFSEQRGIHDNNAIESALKAIEDKTLLEEREGALWFRSSELGDDKDRVVRRSSGQWTYLAADFAYLVDKFSRGFDHVIYLWGADHHGTVNRLLAAADALGFGRDRVEIRLIQIVTLSEGGQTLKGSKRAGVIVELDDLVDEVGADAARYTFLTRSMDAPLEFDIALAKEQAPENPVYYVQYAHARIASILRKAAEEGIDVRPGEAVLSELGHPSEDELMRKLSSFEEIVPEAASLRAPQRVTRYIEELASVFSAFYRDCKVISEDKELTRARLTLCVATKRVIADGLALLGVSAPERM